MKLPIVKYGNPILRAKGKRIGEVDEQIRALADDMLETMRAVNGVGLAAQQVGHALQLTVLDISQVEDRPSTMKLNGDRVNPNAMMPLKLVNPELTLGNDTEWGEEGCLSIPLVSAEVQRAASVIARARTVDGYAIEIEATGLLARALQHEVDHLNGILFTDRLPAAAKTLVAPKLKRIARESR